MQVKEIWTAADFEEMGWHDSYIHSISFPDERLQLSLDIDYLFEWVLDNEANHYKFWIAPCSLVFEEVLYLEINLDFQNVVSLDILDIVRLDLGVYPGTQNTKWRYEINTDKGKIGFESSGYRQIVKQQPVLSEAQILNR